MKTRAAPATENAARILKNCCRQGLISIRRWMYSTLRVFRTPFPKFWALPAEERIPDRVFDQAARVEFVDCEPEDLRERLIRQDRTDLLSEYSQPKLSALRELALRRCADRTALE